MITKLPIVIDFDNPEDLKFSGKIIFHNFKIKIINDMIILDVINPYNDLNFIKIPCVNKYNCIYYMKVCLPLELKIIDNILISPYFFTILMQTGVESELDFFYSLINFLKSRKFKYKLLDMDILINNNNILNNIIKYNNSFRIKKEYKNVYTYLKAYYKFFQFNFNTSLSINFLFSNFTKKKIKSEYNLINKLTLSMFNIIKNFKFSYKCSHTYTINQHIKYFSEDNIDFRNIKKKRSYFIKKKNKFFNIFINDIKNDTIILDNKKFNKDGYSFYIYPNDFKESLNKECLFNYLSTKDVFLEICNIYNTDNNNLLEYFINDNFIKEKLIIDNDIVFKNIEEEFNCLNSTDNDFIVLCKFDIKSPEFIEILKKYSFNFELKKKVLFMFFKKYNFPFKYNKREFDNIFIKIIYFSFLNYSSFIGIYNDKISLHEDILKVIPIKLRTLYYNIMKIYYECMELKIFNNIRFNPKLYNDAIHYDVIKIIFETDNVIRDLFKLDMVYYNKILKIINNVILLMQISKRLKWKNLSKNLKYLDEFLINKDIVFFQDKLNKTIIPINFDTRIKRIIGNPFDMFKYLKKEKDFIKWLKFLDNKILNYYNVPFIFTNNDYVNLGKLLFLLVGVKTQSLEDNTYLKFLNFCNKNNKLILNESRINLRIKDGFKFLKNNINLGYLAKHLTWENQIPITFGNINVNKLERENKILSKKYYKYKGKYIKLKKNTESINFDSTISLNMTSSFSEKNKYKKNHKNKSEYKIIKKPNYKVINKPDDKPNDKPNDKPDDKKNNNSIII